MLCSRTQIPIRAGSHWKSPIGTSSRPLRIPIVCSSDAVRQLENFSAGVRTSLATPPAAAATENAPGGLQELNKDTFDPFLAEASDKLIIVDFYTDWCGPCKMIYPELVKLNEELQPKAQIVKVNCNKANKDLGVKLAIKVAPTFHLYRNSTKVAEMTGAKVEKLRALIEEHIEPK